MPITLLETQVTATMSLREARSLHKLLSLLPNKRNDVAISAADFTPQDWECFGNYYKALDCELEGKA